jgi:hypothetical protein
MKLNIISIGSYVLQNISKYHFEEELTQRKSGEPQRITEEWFAYSVNLCAFSVQLCVTKKNYDD